MLRTRIDPLFVILVDDHNLLLAIVLHNYTRVSLAVQAANQLLVKWLWSHIERQFDLVLFFRQLQVVELDSAGWRGHVRYWHRLAR